MSLARQIKPTGEGAPAPSLVRYDAACRALAEAKSVDDVKDIRDRSEAMRAYAKQAKNKQLEVDAAEIRIRAERRLGEMIAAQRDTVGLNSGALRRGSEENPRDIRPTLAEAGIDKNLADRARKLAAIPEAEFTEIVSDWRDRVERENERVSINLLKSGERHAAAQPVDNRTDAERDADTIQSVWDRACEQGRTMFLARNNLQSQAKASEDNGATGKAMMRRADSMAGEVSRSTSAADTDEGDGRDVEAAGGAASVTTNFQSDGDAFSEVKGTARPENAAGVEPSSPDIVSASAVEAVAESQAPQAPATAEVSPDPHIPLGATAIQEHQVPKLSGAKSDGVDTIVGQGGAEPDQRCGHSGQEPVDLPQVGNEPENGKAASVTQFTNQRCLNPDTCKWAHSQSSCSACNQAWMKARAA